MAMPVILVHIAYVTLLPWQMMLYTVDIPHTAALLLVVPLPAMDIIIL